MDIVPLTKLGAQEVPGTSGIARSVRGVMRVLAALSGVGIVLASAAPTAVNHSAAVTVRLTPGFHLVRQRVTEVTEPYPRLVFASFAVKLARRSCECGTPNIRNLPRAGAFVLMWEYPAMRPSEMTKDPVRPARFAIRPGRFAGSECAGPDWATAFRVRRRAFQLEVYLGPADRRKIATEVEAILNGMRIDPLG